MQHSFDEDSLQKAILKLQEALPNIDDHLNEDSINIEEDEEASYLEDLKKRFEFEQAKDNHAFNLELKGLELEYSKLNLEIRATDQVQKNKIATQLFVLLIAYMVVVLGLVILVGMNRFTISDPVLMTLLGTTSINIIGLYAYVARYFFPSSK